MHTFFEWLDTRPVVWAIQRLLENAEFFDRAAFNRVFDQELRSTLDRISASEAREEARNLLGWDWINYIESSLKSAGFRDPNDLQEHTQGIVVKLLVQPGQLFRGWKPQQHGPLDRRFKNSVWNAIRNIAEKEQTRHRYLPSRSIGTTFEPGDVMASELKARQSGRHEVIEEFRTLVYSRLGELALTVLDHRLEGRETKELIGLPSLGTPSRHQVKQAVRAIKAVAQQFAQQTGDTGFLRMIEAAMAKESETVRKRLGVEAG